ncbi:MAG: hypothetical protein ACPL4I_11185 [Bacteroidota bacterium]
MATTAAINQIILHTKYIASYCAEGQNPERQLQKAYAKAEQYAAKLRNSGEQVFGYGVDKVEETILELGGGIPIYDNGAKSRKECRVDLRFKAWVQVAVQVSEDELEDWI